MFTRLLASILIASSTCSIICGTACDFIEPGECLDDGALFGPCDDGQCAADLTCMSTSVGDMCIPPETWAAHDDVPACAYWLGTLGCNSKTDQCFLQCESQVECRGGTVCDKSIGKCVHPFIPPGECGAPGSLFGPCVDNECYLGLLCFSSQSGDSCVPPGSFSHEWSATVCAAQVGDALMCVESEGFCAPSCESNADCVDSVCDDHTNICVHPWG